MQALKDILASERGLIGLALIIAATVLTVMSLMTVVEWQDYSMKIFGIYVGGKSLTTAVAAFRGSPDPIPATSAAPAAPAAPAASAEAKP